MEHHYLFLLVTVLRPRMLSVQGLVEHKKLELHTKLWLQVREER